MSSIIRVLDKRSGITYVYNNVSYWNKEKKSPRNRRTLIGKVDPETGEVVPTNGNRRRAMERKAQESENQLSNGISVLENERTNYLQKYLDVLENYDLSLQSLEEDIKHKRKEIDDTRQKLSQKQ